MEIPIPTYIYHITHIDNLVSIVQTGGLYSYNKMQAENREYRNIAHQDIQDYRAHKTISCGPGGVLHNYVPFSFAPRSPMLCSLYHNNVAGHTGGQTPIIHLVTDVQKISKVGLEYVFTDGHGKMEFSDFYNDLDRLDQVDWEIMKARYWRDTDVDPDCKRRRQAEFLFKDFCPWALISEIGVINSSLCSRVQMVFENLEHKPVVSVRPNWYY